MSTTTKTRIENLLEAQQANREAYSRAACEGDAAAMRKLRTEANEISGLIASTQEEQSADAEIARDLRQLREPAEKARRREEAIKAGHAALDCRNEAFKRLLELEIARRDFMRELVDSDRQALTLFGSTLTGHAKEGFESSWGGIDGQWMSRLVAEAAGKCSGFPASKRGEALKPYIDRFTHQAEFTLRTLPGEPTPQPAKSA